MSLTELPWDPLRPAEVAGLFTGVQWWVAAWRAPAARCSRHLVPPSRFRALSRRDPRVRRSISTLGNVTESGIPYLVPEIQLFYKSTSPRRKDQIDFDAALPLLSAAQRQWLVEAIGIVEG
jgi:hypothetical protein